MHLLILLTCILPHGAEREQQQKKQAVLVSDHGMVSGFDTGTDGQLAVPECPTGDSKHWQKCVEVKDCVYIPGQGSKLDNVPLESGTCLKMSKLKITLGLPPNYEFWKETTDDDYDDWKPESEEGDEEYGSETIKIRVDTSKSGTRFIHVEDIDPAKMKKDEDEEDVAEPRCVDNEPHWKSPSKWPAKHKRHELKSCNCKFWKDVERLKHGKVSSLTTNYKYAKEDPENFLLIEYGCWRDILSRKLRMPVQFEYIASYHSGADKHRASNFAMDDTDTEMEEWQPPGWSKGYKYGDPWDVGHLVMANHFDNYKELIENTNLMTNVVPQHKDMNRLAWLATEYITECARKDKPPRKDGKVTCAECVEDAENVFVMGGCVWNETNPGHVNSNSLGSFFRNRPYIDSFVVGNDGRHAPYQLLIPDYCWKVLSTPNRGHVAFWVPNNEEAHISMNRKLKAGVEEGLTDLSKYVVSLNELEELLKDRQTPQEFTLPAYKNKDYEDKDYKPTAQQMQNSGWNLHCDKK
jgi:DNA/RNA endonuclease G (NUC1)